MEIATALSYYHCAKMSPERIIIRNCNGSQLPSSMFQHDSGEDIRWNCNHSELLSLLHDDPREDYHWEQQPSSAIVIVSGWLQIGISSAIVTTLSHDHCLEINPGR